jgi:hypothetical protein
MSSLSGCNGLEMIPPFRDKLASQYGLKIDVNVLPRISHDIEIVRRVAAGYLNSRSYTGTMDDDSCAVFS